MLKLVQNSKPGNLCNRLKSLQKRKKHCNLITGLIRQTCQRVKAKGLNEKPPQAEFVCVHHFSPQVTKLVSRWSLLSLWTPNSYVWTQVRKHLLWCPRRRVAEPRGASRHSTELFSCWTIWRGNQRPGLGALALCLFIIWVSLARLCLLFTPSNPEQTSLLAGVPFFQAPFCTSDAGKFVSSHRHFILALCLHSIILATPPPIPFAVPVGPVISSARAAQWSTMQICNGHPSQSLQHFGSLFWVIWKKDILNNCHYGWLLGGKCFD